MQHIPTENVHDWIRLIRSEFAEMPGLRLSKCQAQRLWNLDSESAEMILGVLETTKFLRRTLDDMYIRADIAH